MSKEKEASEKLILKSGLEIHQQLDSGKLFCRCPSILRQDQPDWEVRRKLHVVAGESGEIDVAVKHEAEKDREFVYQGYTDTNCLVEFDESPPLEIDPEALKIALQISLLLNCEILQDTQIMRKTVIDGSNVSGFQRTTLIARNGFVETEEGKVEIDSIMLEEDAARPANITENNIEENNNVKTYKLDRLGIPLVEIATSPDIKSAKQAKEVALHIGDILRACKVRRGIGTIRQDVNFSLAIETKDKSGKTKIKQGERVEIKGVQDPPLIEKTILTETQRQKPLVEKDKTKREVRKALPDGTTEFLRPMPGAARMYPETDLPLLHIYRDTINEVRRSLPRLKSEIKEELKAKGLTQELTNLVLQENKVRELQELLQIHKDANLIAKLLVLWPKEIASRENKSIEKINKKVTLDVIETILQALNSKTIQESDAKSVLENYIKGKPIQEALKVEKIENLEDEILKIIKSKPGLNANAYMGLVMAKFKGKISGKEAMEILKKLVKQ